MHYLCFISIFWTGLTHSIFNRLILAIFWYLWFRPDRLVILLCCTVPRWQKHVWLLAVYGSSCSRGVKQQLLRSNRLTDFKMARVTQKFPSPHYRQTWPWKWEGNVRGGSSRLGPSPIGPGRLGPVSQSIGPGQLDDWAHPQSIGPTSMESYKLSQGCRPTYRKTI